MTFRAPFKGNVLVTAETDREILRRVLTIDGGGIKGVFAASLLPTQ